MKEQKCKTSPMCSHNTNGRDLNKPCSIEFNPMIANTNPMQDSDKTVEEKMKFFDERYFENFVYWQEIKAEIYIGDPDFNSLRKAIKDALTEVSAASRREAIEKTRKQIEKAFKSVNWIEEPKAAYGKFLILIDELKKES